MPTTKKDDPAELLRLAIIGLDAQIAESRETRAKLAAMIDGQPAGRTAKVAGPGERRKLSAEARAKISIAAKARWARDREAQAQKQKPKHNAKKAQTKAKPAKAKPAPAKAKKSPGKKGKSE